MKQNWVCSWCKKHIETSIMAMPEGWIRLKKVGTDHSHVFCSYNCIGRKACVAAGWECYVADRMLLRGSIQIEEKVINSGNGWDSGPMPPIPDTGLLNQS